MMANQPENNSQTETQNEKNEELTDLHPNDVQIEDTKGGASSNRYLRDLLLD
jgi:hypothetical protein